MTDKKADFEDADLAHPWAERYRLPLVADAYFMWRYEVALVLPKKTPSYEIRAAVTPTEEEAAILGSVIDYRRSYYRQSHQDKMLARALDVDGTTNTFVFVKHEDSWRYRYASWTMGPTFAPTNAKDACEFPPTPAGLVKMLNEVFYGDGQGYLRSDWVEFMDSRPEVFSAHRTDVTA